MNSDVRDNATTVGKTPAEYFVSRIEQFAQRIHACDDIDQIVALLDQALRETGALGANESIHDAGTRISEAQREIEHLKAELDQANTLMELDLLTEALNRRGLARAFQREAARCDRHGLAMSVALVDIDDFKLVNDHYGHVFGDEALSHFVGVMRTTLRPSDLIARYGGEEFVLIFPHTGPQAAAAALARLKRALAVLPVLRTEDSVFMTFSAGLAGRQPREDEDSLIGRADAALLVAKRSGKNCSVMAT